MRHPITPVHDKVFDIPLCVCEWSLQLKEWVATQYATLAECKKHYDNIKEHGPAMILQFGWCIEDNETEEEA